MDYFIECIHNIAVIAGFSLVLLVRALVTAPVQLLKWIGKHSLIALIVVDMLLLALLVWVLWATDWSPWGHW